MDPNFFGVRVEVEERGAHNGKRLVNASDLRANQLEGVNLKLKKERKKEEKIFFFKSRLLKQISILCIINNDTST